jgi:hypothetical protein
MMKFTESEKSNKRKTFDAEKYFRDGALTNEPFSSTMFDSRKLIRMKSTGYLKNPSSSDNINMLSCGFGAFSTMQLKKLEKVVAFQVLELSQPTVREMVNLGTAVKGSVHAATNGNQIISDPIQDVASNVNCARNLYTVDGKKIQPNCKIQRPIRNGRPCIIMLKDIDPGEELIARAYGIFLSNTKKCLL